MLLRRLAGTAATLAVLASSAAAQTVLTFDDVPSTSCNNSALLGLYGGVDFQGRWTCFTDEQPPFNPRSGTARVFASDGVRNSPTSQFAFTSRQFSGAWFSGNGGTSVFFQLFSGATLLHTSGALGVSATPTFLASGFGTAVDRVRVVGSDVLWVMDDVTFGPTTVVPEPSTYLLLATGLVGIAMLRRRKSRSTK
jgi:hypothetical protein